MRKKQKTNGHVNGKTNGKPNGVGRPRLDIDRELIHDLAGIGCTTAEMAVICGCSRDTLERNFAAEIEKGRENVKMRLRRRQLEVAMKGNPALLIWLGKQMLDQRDRQEVSGPGGGPIQHEHFDLSKLSSEQLSELERLVESATGSIKAAS